MACLSQVRLKFTRRAVAPRAGAWIETKSSRDSVRAASSPLVQGRGLKHRGLLREPVVLLSPLVQGRGLKRVEGRQSSDRGMSPLVQGRGLKHRVGRADRIPPRVAPRAGAWIETYSPSAGYSMAIVAPRAGAWIETWNTATA